MWLSPTAITSIGMASSSRATEAAIAKAIDGASFPKLQAQEEAAGFVEKAKTAKQFFRSGTTGQWKEVLTDAQRKRIEDANGEVMQRFGYDCQ
jgi:aryl sulfotransferase